MILDTFLQGQTVAKWCTSLQARARGGQLFSQKDLSLAKKNLVGFKPSCKYTNDLAKNKCCKKHSNNLKKRKT